VIEIIGTYKIITAMQGTTLKLHSKVAMCNTLKKNIIDVDLNLIVL